MLKLVVLIFAFTCSPLVQAGLFDKLTDMLGNEDAPATPPPQTQSNSKPLLDTGLQLLPALSSQLGVSNEQAAVFRGFTFIINRN